MLAAPVEDVTLDGAMGVKDLASLEAEIDEGVARVLKVDGITTGVVTGVAMLDKGVATEVKVPDAAPAEDVTGVTVMGDVEEYEFEAPPRDESVM